MSDPAELAHSTYEQVAGAYADRYLNDFSDSELIDQFAALLPSSGSVLDAGCGPGIFSGYLAGKGHQVIGLDTSPAMLEIARDNFSNADFVLGDMRSPDFADETFDGLLAAYSLIHVPTIQVQSTLLEFHRLLKPGGVLAVLAQRGDSDQVVIEPLDTSLRTFVNFFQLESLTKQFTHAGFDVLDGHLRSSDDESKSDEIIWISSRKL